MVIPPDKRGQELPSKLEAEWPDILQWAIDGCLLWQSEGLNAPRKVTDATRAYLLDEDSVAAWMAETCWVGRAYAPSD